MFDSFDHLPSLSQLSPIFQEFPINHLHLIHHHFSSQVLCLSIVFFLLQKMPEINLPCVVTKFFHLTTYFLPTKESRCWSFSFLCLIHSLIDLMYRTHRLSNHCMLLRLCLRVHFTKLDVYFSFLQLNPNCLIFDDFIDIEYFQDLPGFQIYLNFFFNFFDFGLKLVSLMILDQILNYFCLLLYEFQEHLTSH